jgi:anaerobic selenocysteine-containing dehydrogenase
MPLARAHVEAGDEATAWLTCPLCEAACGLEITVRDGVPVRVRGDRHDPMSRGYLCPKGASLIGLHADPDRLRRPMIRRDGLLVEVGWDEAFAEAERLIHDLLARHGRDALATFVGNPSAYNLSLLLFGPQLIRAVRSGKHFSSGSVDILPKQFACALMYGHTLSIPVPDVDQTDYLLILGANPLVSNGSALTAPNLPGRFAALKERGGRLVVVDPVRTKTAAAADEHLFIRPGTDVWLLAAMVRSLLADEHVDLGVQGDHVAGLDELRTAVDRFTPDIASPRTGIPAATITRLARELAAAPRAAVYGRVGTCVQEHGALASWLIEVLNVVTGNLDVPGGTRFTSPVIQRARDRRWIRSQERQHGRYHARASGLPALFGALPAAAVSSSSAETPPCRYLTARAWSRRWPISSC